MRKFGTMAIMALGAWSLSGCGDCSDGATAQCTVPATGAVGNKTCTGGAWGDCIPAKVCEDGDSKDCKTADAKDGVKVCANNTWGTCKALGACTTGEKQSCKTTCGTGEETCVNNNWDSTTCNAPKPGTETCDGIDNDCNGVVDDPCVCKIGTTMPCYTGPAGTENVGICKGGTKTCMLMGTAAGWGDCTGEVKPAAMETCGNGLDDNCNMMPDDGCVCTAGQTQPCGSDVGTCKKGTQTCQTVGGKLDFGPCTGATEPVAEKTLGCDGKDNDCNGMVDDNIDADGNEPNNACVNVHAPSTVTNEDNGAIKLDKFSLYPTGDVDIIQITAQEKASTLCVWPLTYDQCHMLKLKFTNPAVNGVDFQYTIQTDKCGGTVQGTVPAGSAGPYAWTGITGFNDDKDFWIKVEPKSSSNPSFTCMPYTIEAQMVTECGHCCTFVPCKDNAACTKAGCGSCDTAKGVCKK